MTFHNKGLTLVTYTQTYTPPWYKGGGLNPPTAPPSLDFLRHFENIWPLIDSLLCALEDNVNIMGMASLGSSDVIQMAANMAAILNYINN